MNYTINIALLALVSAFLSLAFSLVAINVTKDTNERLEASRELQAAYQVLLFSVTDNQTLQGELNQELINKLK